MKIKMKERQEEAKKEQKIFAAVLAGMVVIFTYMFVRDNMWWVMIGLTYAAVVVAVIFYELIDEAWVATCIQEYNNLTPEEPLAGTRMETAIIDIIS